MCACMRACGTSRKQYIEMNDCKSPLIKLTHGVPQGSTLGPVLFLSYSNDIQIYYLVIVIKRNVTTDTRLT